MMLRQAMLMPNSNTSSAELSGHMRDPATHWDDVYSAKRAEEVSWHQAEPALSLKLIRRTGIARDAALVDVGGGASTLVDHLIRDGFSDVTVLDIAAPALEHSRARLGADAERATWIAADVTAWRPGKRFRLWHDRAVLHFLTEPDHQAAYARTLHAALEGDGWAIIAGFAPGGPAKCSGLPIVQHDGESLQRLLGDELDLMETHNETHLTPWGAEQAFRYHLFRRSARSV
jgi:hypothetical protein